MATDKERIHESTTSQIGETGSSSSSTPRPASIGNVFEPNGFSGTRPPMPVSQKAKKCAQELKQEREKKGWTQQQLADEVGVSISEVQEWENGTSYPKADDQRKLSKVFEKDICS